MNAMDLSFDCDAARIWKSNVDAEIRAVEQTLSEVSSICTDLPSNDSILTAIGDAGNRLQEKWSELENVFSKVSDTTSNIIAEYEKNIEALVEKINKSIRR